MYVVREVPDQNALQTFCKFVFGRIGADNASDFSTEMIARCKNGSQAAAEVQDSIMSSDEFRIFNADPMWKDLVASALECEPEEVRIGFPHLRIDLPRSFSADEKKISLPWHQEAAYFLEKGNCSPKSVVISTYLHDCDKASGALELATEPESDVVEHELKFLDLERKKHQRVEACSPATTRFAETTFGQSLLFDFLTLHRSGVIEHPDRVRVTHLLRAGKQAEIDAYAAQKVAS